MSLLAIPMYLDTIADSILKGINMQNACLKYNIIDSFIRVIAIIVLMPGFGPVFYVAMLYISEIFNLSLSIGKVASVTGFRPDRFRSLILPFLCALGALLVKAPAVQALVYAGLYFGISKIYTSYHKVH